MQNAPRELVRAARAGRRRVAGGATSHDGQVRPDAEAQRGGGRGALAGALEYSTGPVRRGDGRADGRALRGAAEAGGGADLRSRCSAVSLLSEEECRRLLAEWNATDARPSDDDDDHPAQLFEQQAQATPEAVAVEGEGERLTYAELDARAGALARHLRALGVGPESRVAVMLQPSTELVVALLGVVKAGGAYVPLDTSTRAARLGFIMEDTQARVLLTHARCSARCPGRPRTCCAWTSGARPTPTGRGAGPRRRPAAEGAQVDASPANLAYVIYTSGSTGQPKGVGITHAAAPASYGGPLRVHRLVAGAHGALLVVAFDLSVSSTVAAPADGRHAHRLSGHGRRGAGSRRGLRLRAAQADAGHSGCSWARPARQRRALLILGGEGLASGLAREAVESVRRRGGGVQRVRADGGDGRVPALPVRPGHRRGGRRCRSGGPRAETRVYVLDAQLRPTAEGVGGEVYIGGAGVARGYLGQAGLTAERFIPDPFGVAGRAPLPDGGCGAAAGRTGDLEYLGRHDAQVKVRGVRLELGEVRGGARPPCAGARRYAVVRAGAGACRRWSATTRRGRRWRARSCVGT